MIRWLPKIEWHETPWCSYRYVPKFAWLPVCTFDQGWIWWKDYWIYEKVWGWGFHDKYPYVHPNVSEPIC